MVEVIISLAMLAVIAIAIAYPVSKADFEHAAWMERMHADRVASLKKHRERESSLS
jgi:hypothetical protein